jgi:hypothetical protein
MKTHHEHTGRLRIKNTETGFYLVQPVKLSFFDRYTSTAPEWTPIPEAAFRFKRSHAEDQILEIWHKHKQPSKITTSTKQPPKT